MSQSTNCVDGTPHNWEPAVTAGRQRCFYCGDVRDTPADEPMEAMRIGPSIPGGMCVHDWQPVQGHGFGLYQCTKCVETRRVRADQEPAMAEGCVHRWVAKADRLPGLYVCIKCGRRERRDEPPIDTSDIPEVGEEWFQKARRVSPPNSTIEQADRLLFEAHALITGARQTDYGPPERNFADIATGWEIIFRKGVTPSTVALAMCWLKTCRTQTSPGKMDSYADLIGYAALAGALAVPTPIVVSAKALNAAMGEKPEPCDHEWADARNEVIESGEYCTKCHAVRASGSRAEEPDEPGETAGVTRNVYKSTPEGEMLLHARFPNGGGSPGTFLFDGHRWRYEHTSFDDDGEFDVLWRPKLDRQPAHGPDDTTELEKRLEYLRQQLINVPTWGAAVGAMAEEYNILARRLGKSTRAHPKTEEPGL